MFAALLLIASTAQAEQFDFVAPADCHAFGASVAVLPNGNVVVTDPFAGSAQTGAVYLYTADGELISTLHGTTASDNVGLGGVVVLPSGNFLVFSPFWTNTGAAKAGAVTFVDGTHGLNTAVSPQNSLVGSSPGDEVGYLSADFNLTGLTLLTNGNYLVVSPQWSNTAGAVTWGDGGKGVSGVVSAANSLTGTVAGDAIGTRGLVNRTTALKNGNYVVASPGWHNGSAASAGAVTWGSGTIGTHGAVSASNSLVGSSTTDSVGTQVSELANGNIVIASPTWSSANAKAVGAVTWASGTKPTVGVISSANSLTGTLENDLVGYGLGYGGVHPLSNGNYVVASPRWSASVGAVTWSDANGKTVGAVSSANSMVGTAAGDNVGSIVTPLANGNYVVVSRSWHNSGGASVGAATWVDGSAPFSGAISTANSLTGAASRDGEEMTAVALANGNYVVADPSWKNSGAGPLRADGYGSVTWGDGSVGVRGVISSANSLTGSQFGDLAGAYIYPLSNGNYVVLSPWWSNAGQVLSGAATWADGSKVTSGQIGSQNSLLGASVASVTTLADGDYVVHSGRANTTTGYAITRCSGTSPTTGQVSPLNSLVGNNSGDVSVASVMPLDDSSFVVDIPAWHNNRGAVTWVGPSGLTGIVSASNSLVGSSENDLLGSNALISYGGPDPIGTPMNGSVVATGNGNYIVTSPYWSNGSMHEAGAVSLGHPGQLVGTVNVDNSVMGSVAFGGADLVSAYDSARDRLVVGQPDANRVTILGSHLTPPQFDLNQHGLTGSWFNPATAGQGLEVEVYPDASGSGRPVLFGGWFTFDATGAGNPRWYAMQGAPGATPRTFDVDIATGYGGAFAQPPVVAGSAVGHGTLAFNDCNSGVLTYTLNDGTSRSGTVPLARLIANVTCTASGDRGPPGSYLLSGSWFDPATGGQGLIVEVNPVQPYLFAAWYTFTPNGTRQNGADGQRWYTLQFGALTTGDTHIDQIGIYTASGGRFDAPAPVTVQQVGNASLSLDSCQSLTLSYVFYAGINAGQAGSTHLVRTGPVPAGCSL